MSNTEPANAPAPVAVEAATSRCIRDDVLRELRQAELITGLVQYDYDPTVEPDGQARKIVHAYAVVASQDCDLLRHYDEGCPDDLTIINCVLLLEAEPADEARAKSRLGTKEWRSVRNNKNERYHVLAAIPPALDRENEGLPELVLDFRRFFAMTPREVYRQCADPAGAKRRCRLEIPYREQLQNRVAFYLQRIALPEDDD